MDVDGPEEMDKETDDTGWMCSRKLLIAIGIFIVGLYALGISSQWRFQRDSTIYLTLARSIIEGDGYTYNYTPHTKYTPGLPVLLAGVGALSDMPETLSDSFLAHNLLMMFLGLGSILLFYLILRELDLPPPIFSAAFLFFAFSRPCIFTSPGCQRSEFTDVTRQTGTVKKHSGGSTMWTTSSPTPANQKAPVSSTNICAPTISNSRGSPRKGR